MLRNKNSKSSVETAQIHIIAYYYVMLFHRFVDLGQYFWYYVLSVHLAERPPMASRAPDLVERRVAERRYVFKSAQVVFHQRYCVLNCVVRDYSSTGARLYFHNFQPLPERFDLVFGELGTVDCELVRSQDKDY
ncbi:MAG TPA: hypothetical protein VF920_03790, partial [Dongiaceae bacterium]